MAWLVVVVVVVPHTHSRKSYTCIGELNFYTNPAAAVVVIAIERIPLRQPLIIVCFALAYVFALSFSVCFSLSVSVVE